MRRKILSLAMAICMIASVCPVKASGNVALNDKTKKVESVKHNYAEGEAIVMYYDSASSKYSAKEEILNKDMEIVNSYDFEQNNGKVKAKSGKDNKLTISLVKSDKYSTEELIAQLKKKSNVKYAEPNLKLKKSDYNDSLYKYQWNQDNKGQNGGVEGLDVNADTPIIKDKDDKERVVAIIDSGIDYTHEDLKDVIWNNPYNNKKLRGEHGYDFANYDDDPMDDNGHGSHCAGIIAASANNKVGIAGTARSNNIKIMALKMLDSEGYAYGMEAIGAYNYIYKAQQLGINVVAINNSWGGASEGEESDILKTVIDMVGENGAVSVCAAGNDGNDNDIMMEMPASIDSPYVISVAASNEKDELAGFSNYGMSSVDIAAPGTDILSSVSYNCFNPTTYENKSKLCSMYQDFNTGDVVDIGSDVADDDVVYSLGSTGKGRMEVSTTNKEYFGEKSNTNKSLKWTINDAEEGEYYYLYLPYDMNVSKTGTYASIMAKGEGPEKDFSEIPDFMDWFFNSDPILYFADCEQNADGAFEIKDIDEEYIMGSYIDKGNYWTHFSSQISEENKKKEKHATVLCVEATRAGDYIINVDNWGISKENIEEDAFGKYDFYNGTSMATPHVTGAIAAVANSYPSENALEVKARVLGSARKSDSLDGMVRSGGVLDLAKVDNPEISIENIKLNQNNQIEINGYYMENAKVYIDNAAADVISNNGRVIVVDAKSSLNKSITVAVEKNGRRYEEQFFFSSGKPFNECQNSEGYLNGGDLVSTGNGMIYIDANGNVSYGTPDTDKKTKKEYISWKKQEKEFSTKLFGKEYAQLVDYEIYNDCDYVYSNGIIYGSLALDVGYASEKMIVSYTEKDGWKKLSDIPEEMGDLEGSTLAAYNGDLYLIGGVDDEGNIATTVKKYSVSSKKWTDAIDLPNGRAYSSAIQVGKKLVVTLGADGTENIPKNLIFDGKTWKKSAKGLGFSVDTYFVDRGDTGLCVTQAQIGLVNNGIIYTDLKVEVLGDTFVYDVDKDTYYTSDYALNSSALDSDFLFATTVQDKLYVMYGKQHIEEEEEEFWSNHFDSISDEIDVDDEAGVINVLNIPVTSGYIKVVDESAQGAKVNGTGYYLPGDKITLNAVLVDKNMTIYKFIVNGKIVPKTASGYVYTVNASDCPNVLKVKVELRSFESYIVPESKRAKIKKATRSKNNKKIKLSIKRIDNAKEYQIKYSTKKKFSKKTTKTFNSKKTTVTLKKLNSKKTYFIKVRAYTTKKAYGLWSKVKRVKVRKK